MEFDNNEKSCFWRLARDLPTERLQNHFLDVAPVEAVTSLFRRCGSKVRTRKSIAGQTRRQMYPLL